MINKPLIPKRNMSGKEVTIYEGVPPNRSLPPSPQGLNLNRKCFPGANMAFRKGFLNKTGKIL